MTDLCAFEYAADGAFIVCSDGSELLVHGGADEAPLWADRLPGRLVAVRISGTDLLALDEAGHLRIYNTALAQAGGTADQPHRPLGPFGAPAVGLAMARHQPLAAVLAGSGLFLLSARMEPRKLSSLTGLCVALDAAGTQVAVGTEAGQLHLLQVETGLVDARIDLDHPVTGVVHHPFGFWVAAAGERLFPFSPRGEPQDKPTKLPEGWRPESLCSTADGRLVGFRADPHTAVVLAWNQKEIAGQFTYEREVGQVAFGPGRFFGLGLCGGDGNKFDLASGMTYRTDTFAHRTHNSWVLGVQIDSALATGGGAAAVLAAPAPVQAARTSSKPSRWVAWGLGLLALLGLILAAWLVVVRDESRHDAAREQAMREDIKRSIRGSVEKHMGENRAP